MKKPLLIALLLLSMFALHSQGGKITGTVKDAENNISLELATISLLRSDSSMLTYTLTDKNGKFTIDKLPVNQPLFFNVTYTGYTPYHSSINLNSGKTDSLNIVLKVAERDSNEVIVRSIVPIRMNGDTLEINPDAFKLPAEAVLEDWLTQISGITIWSDGSITMNGKKVEQLFVDGKPFLGSSDPRITTQNLPKSAIEKIQLYQEYDRSKLGKQQTDNDSLLTMNVKLKEDSKKGYFGKLSGSYGSKGRYESDLTLQVYNKRNSFGLGGGINNTNKTIGNLQELFQKNTFRTYYPGLYNNGQFSTMGINRNRSLGGVFTHNFIETQSSRQANVLELSYNNTGTNTYMNTYSLQNRTTIANPQVIQQNNEMNSVTNKHEWSADYAKRNSYSDNLELSGKVMKGDFTNRSEGNTEVRDTANQLQNTNQIVNSQKQQQNTQSLTGNFRLNDRENPLKNIGITLNAQHSNTITDRNAESYFRSFTDFTKDTSFNRNYLTNNNNSDISLNLDYGGMKRLLFGRLRLMGLQIQFNQNLHYMHSTDSVYVADYDSTNKLFKKNIRLSNINQKEFFEYSPGFYLLKSFENFSERKSKGVELQAIINRDFKKEKNQSSFTNRNLNRSFQFMRYTALVNYFNSKYQKNNINFYIMYSKNFRYPGIDQLYTIVDDINIYSIVNGNPLLKNESIHSINFNFRYNSQNPKSPYSFSGNINSNYNFIKNPITDSLINDFSGKRFSYFINSDKSKTFSINSNINLSRKIKKSALQLSYFANLSRQQVPNYVDSRYNISNSVNLMSRSSLQFSLRTLLILNIEHSLQYSKSQQTATRINSFKNSTNSIKGGMTLHLPYNIMLNSTVENINNSNLNKPVVLWNSFASYRFMKQQAEFKFSAMDILKQYKNITNSSDPFGTTVRVTNGLQQYFLVTLSYFPRKFGKTTIAKPK